ncbi:hypothetical protein NEUTE1DRAFT_111238 [Neurospora tetrasperma FGSC 2508]|uniref:Uncharacterized protein n=1 Tax=Neurospora tetrasperma (strain FGSC 2508 / ATCC MYA-4615 / P0657) TaxID=510951 RepID=F8MR40_NEUT8|nr:uncharacterized protein NEUTE1DRAFT_111238 [Neurospora tetrasperma FGSC 2508]EGO56820.1 hypothetical protein NEUTE1DRAFT_111238 [Neurospora tetrasperma FGSC 2508]
MPGLAKTEVKHKQQCKKKVDPPSANWIELTLIVDNQDADVASWVKEVVAEDELILKIAFTVVASIMSKLNLRNSRTTYLAGVFLGPYTSGNGRRDLTHKEERETSGENRQRNHRRKEAATIRSQQKPARYRERETPEKSTCSVKLRYHLSRVLDSAPPPLFPNVAESQCRLDFKRKARLAYNKEYKKNRLDNETPDEREATWASKEEGDR